MSALHQAARIGNLTELRRLLDAGADIEAVDEKNGHTPLMVACLSPQAGVDAVEFLLDRGANLHAHIRPEPNPMAEFNAAMAKLDPEMLLEIAASQDAMLDSLGIAPDLRERIAQAGDTAKQASAIIPESPPLIDLAVQTSDCEKINLLIQRGADLQYVAPHGYTLLINAACAGREDVIDLLLAAGAPLDGQSDWKESALGVLSNSGRFEAVRKILDLGADPAALEWTPLMRAIALGSLQEIADLLNQGAELESRDFWNRTPFLLAIQTGDIGKAALLIEHGADRRATGRCGKTALEYPLDRDDTDMLGWLIDAGFDVNQENEFGHPPILEAAENDAPKCFRLLLAAGAEFNVWEEEILSSARDPEIVGILFGRGSDLAKLESSVVRQFIGLGAMDEMTADAEQFSAARSRRFGTANPERMDVSFWQAMVRCGWSGYRANKHFGGITDHRRDPVWCHDRFGMSLTRLPDGRFIQIAGEHEDHYDPDFCIYNDVIVHDGKGGFEIYGYPEEVFPPTDFHSATLVGDWIYIIGNLGYVAQRGTETPVYRLHVGTWIIERITTDGDSPGWIHSHRAVLENGSIRVSGGKRYTVASDGQQSLDDFHDTWSFDIRSASWETPD